MITLKINNKGQGMPELIAAVGIVIFALASIISLTMFNIKGEKASEDIVIATNLAREGIEVVRNLRDTDWLAGGSVSSALLSSSHKAIILFNSAGNSWSINYNSGYTIDSDAAAVCRNSVGVYVQTTSGCISPNEPTRFRRLITIGFVCTDGTILALSGSCSSIAPVNTISIAAYIVKSEVKWTDKGNSSHTFYLTDYLYLWR